MHSVNSDDLVILILAKDCRDILLIGPDNEEYCKPGLLREYYEGVSDVHDRGFLWEQHGLRPKTIVRKLEEVRRWWLG